MPSRRSMIAPRKLSLPICITPWVRTVRILRSKSIIFRPQKMRLRAAVTLPWGGMLRHLNQGPFGVFIPDLGVDGLEEVDQLKDSAMIQSVRENMVSAIDARISKAKTSLETGKERLAFSRNNTIESTDHLCMQSTAGDKRQYAQQQKQNGEEELPPADLTTDLAQLKEQLRAMKLS